MLMPTVQSLAKSLTFRARTPSFSALFKALSKYWNSRSPFLCILQRHTRPYILKQDKIHLPCWGFLMESVYVTNYFCFHCWLPDFGPTFCFIRFKFTLQVRSYFKSDFKKKKNLLPPKYQSFSEMNLPHSDHYSKTPTSFFWFLISAQDIETQISVADFCSFACIPN